MIMHKAGIKGCRCCGILTAAAVVSCTAAEPVGREAVPALLTTVPEFETPAWAEQQIGDAFARFESWRGTDEVVVFPLVADIHAARPGFLYPPDFRDPKIHSVLAQRAALAFKADFFAELGDIGFDRDLKWKPSKKEDALKRLESQRNLYKGFPLPVLFCMGNHDTGRANGGDFSELRLSAGQYGGMFNGMMKKRGTPLVTGPNEDYGYFDVPGKRSRVFFLNTSDNDERGFSLEQMQFLADGLKGVPPGTCVVLLSHICIHPTLGTWKGERARRIANGEICMRMLADFKTSGKGEGEGVSWDFSKVKDGSITGIFSGHSHVNAQAEHRGIAFVLTQSYGTVSAKDLPEGVDYVTPVFRTRSMLVDMVAVKPDRREFRVFRIGAGGAERDRAFSF